MKGLPSRTSRRACALLIGCALLVGPPSRVQAEAPAGAPSIVVHAPSCPSSPVPFASFVDSLRVELASGTARCCELGVERKDPDAAAEDTVRVVLSVVPCAATTDAMIIDVAWPARRMALTNGLSFADIAPPARPRALSLAVAELVRALGRETPPDAEPARAPSRPVPAATLVAPAPAPPPSEDASPELSGEAELRGYPAAGTSAQTTVLWGARLSVGIARRGLHLALDAGGLLHRQRLDAGDVTLRAPFIGLTVGPAFTVGGFELRLGARGELAWAMVKGQPGGSGVQAGQGSGAVLALGARVLLQARPWHRLRARLAVEGGETLRGVTANVDGIPASAMRGPYVAANLGLAF